MSNVETILESIEKLTLLEAAELVKAMEEKFGNLVVIKDGKVDYASLEDVVGQNKEIGAVSGNTAQSNQRKVTLDDDLVKTARSVGINLGD